MGQENHLNSGTPVKLRVGAIIDPGKFVRREVEGSSVEPLAVQKTSMSKISLLQEGPSVSMR